MKTQIAFVCTSILFLASINVSSQEIENEIVPSTFFSATRLPQIKQNSPTGITIITRQEIRDLGITSLPEVMRLVPGMRMTQANGWDYRVNFHGTNGLVPRRMSVMVNGLYVFRSSQQQVDWMRLPISVNHIERVEVIRSPAGASYGSNAFQLVVNIITRHPNDVPKLELVLEKGTLGQYDYSAQISGKVASTSYLLNVGSQGDTGFDEVKLNSQTPFLEDGNDKNAIERVNLRTDTRINENSNIEIFAGGSKTNVDILQIDSRQTDYGYTNQADWFVQSNYKTTLSDSQSIQVQASSSNTNLNQQWPTCYPTAFFMPALKNLYDVNASLANQIFAGKMPTSSNAVEQQLIVAAVDQVKSLGSDLKKNLCGTGNNDIEERRNNIEFNNTYVVSNSIRVNTGLGFQQNLTTSESHLQGSETSEVTYIFSNGEYNPTTWLTLNAGVLWEHVSTVKNTATSPRVGLNFHLTDDHTLRLVYSTGNRMPSILETDRKWNYYMRDWNRTVFGKNEGWFYSTTYPQNELKPEHVVSTEVGMQGSIDNNRITYDARIFRESYSDLISEKGQFFDYNLSNNNNAKLKGFEGEVKYSVTGKLKLTGGYSYIDSEVSNTFEESLYSKEGGFVTIIYKTKPITYALSYYGNSKMLDESYNRVDLTLSGNFNRVMGGNITWRLSGSYFGFDNVPYERNVGNIVYSRYDEKYSAKFLVGFSF